MLHVSSNSHSIVKCTGLGLLDKYREHIRKSLLRDYMVNSL